MEPNGKFYTQYPGQQYAQQPPKNTRGKVVAFALIIILAVAVAVVATYYYQQQRIDALTSEKSQLSQQIASAATNVADEVLPNQFSYPKVPFTFTYPSNWTLTSSEPVTYTESLPGEYGIELLVPGTVRSVTLAGRPDVISKDGARITIKKIVTMEPDVRKALGVFAGAVPTFEDVTVAGTKGVRFEYMHDGPKYMSTAFVKDDALFTIQFDAEDDADLTKNEYYSTYQSLVNSLQFK